MRSWKNLIPVCVIAVLVLPALPGILVAQNPPPPPPVTPPIVVTPGQQTAAQAAAQAATGKPVTNEQDHQRH